MREIKFRAWDNIKKEWLLGYDYKGLGGFSLFGEMMAMGEWEQILSKMIHGDFGENGNELKVMQYTGLKDTKNREIYEGDILQINAEHAVLKDEVIFEDGMFSLKFARYDKVFEVNDMSEVIGNIYENHELLGGTQ